MTWITLRFPEPIQLRSTAGYSYWLLLESDSVSYATYGLRDGAGIMHAASTFTDGITEFTVDGGTTWCNNTNATLCGGDVNDSRTTDMQFYFRVVTDW